MDRIVLGLLVLTLACLAAGLGYSYRKSGPPKVQMFEPVGPPSYPGPRGR